MPSLRQAIDWEIDHYLAEQIDRLMEGGLSRAEARREAERRFGNFARQRRKIVTADRRRMVMRKREELWDAMLFGMRQAYRGVRRSPGLAVTVVLTLGLGIGVNGAMFAVVDRLLLRPPDHVAEPDKVRRVLREGEWFGTHDIITATTYPDVEDLRAVPEFASAGAVAPTQLLTLGVGEDVRRVRATRATHDFFTTLGVRSHLGRFFNVEQDQVGASGTMVLSHEFWRASFGGDPDVIGRTLDLAGHRMTVIGVAPRGFTGVDLEPVDVWIPAVMAQSAQTGSDDFLTDRRYWWLRSVVRIRDDESLMVAEAKATARHVNSRADAVARGRFDENARIFTAPLIRAQGPEASNESKVARWLVGVSLIVLLIACANVASLLLAHGVGRRREVAVRLSLGVSRGRLVREMVLETLMLAAVGGGVALLLAHWGGGIIRAALIPEVLWTPSSLSGRVVAFSALLSLAAGLVAGVGPAVQSTRADLTRDLTEGGRGSTRGRSRVRGALTVAQATLSAVLLVGAGLFIRSVVEVRTLDLGLDVDRLVMAQLEFEGGDPNELERAQLYQAATEVLESIPGVVAVAGTDVLYQWVSVMSITVPGLDSLPIPPGGGPLDYGVSPGYMRTMGLELLQGRPILETDVEGSPRVAVVNEMMARTLWPGQNPIGKCFHYGGAEECTTVVGVVENASRGALEGDRHLAYHRPLAQTGDAANGLYIRTDGDPREVALRVAPALRSFSPRVRFAEVQPLREILDPQTRSWTIGAALFTAFGVLALIVAAIGLYSVLAFEVAQRTKEIGIRAALGAQKARVLRGVVATGARLAVLGVLIGIVGSRVAAPFARELLFHVDGADPTVLGAVALLLIVVAVIASIVPGLRATRVDPMEALRSE
jgi:predicted permease